MKILKYIALTILIISGCSAPIHIYENCGRSGLEINANYSEPIHIEFKSLGEAKRVKKRIKKKTGVSIYRSGKVLWFHYNELNLTRKLLGHEYGFIREKYQGQILNQLCK